ncbi:FecR family protein [Sediminibacterium goheungense]|uniref:FecR family protein n=1 Tax=Sediminibacterium goheungense TaxID=1086393 RepID=A0A4R6IN46_9BACT|nr:FecR family protein [Sediminibacterium goheungense]TDO23603.1 FecR family protein [Sediminibacterium goheungense]
MNIPDHIQNLISKYEQGLLSATEKKELDNWYHSFDDQQTVVSDVPQGSEDELAERMAVRLQESLAADEERLEPTGVPARKWRTPAAAALIFILLSGVIYYFIQLDNTAAQQPLVLSAPVPAGDVAPGGNKAILTLDDGSVIVLDSAHNGILGEQGDVDVKKLDNGLIAYQNQDGNIPAAEEKIFYNTISTPRGGEYQVTLSDGTKVWLNAASSIRFPTAFRGADRQVQITGEVYFEVAHNETQPFKVTAGKSAIEVLGTHFNVNAYDDEVQVRTSLLEGSVKIAVIDQPDQQQMKILKPGQQARMTRSGRISVVNNIDTEEIMAWKNGLFVFKSTDLRSIMRQIARWYDIDIEYKDNVGMQFTGQITRNNNVSKVLEMLELTEEVKFRVAGKKVIVAR